MRSSSKSTLGSQGSIRTVFLVPLTVHPTWKEIVSELNEGDEFPIRPFENKKHPWGRQIPSSPPRCPSRLFGENGDEGLAGLTRKEVSVPRSEPCPLFAPPGRLGRWDYGVLTRVSPARLPSLPCLKRALFLTYAVQSLRSHLQEHALIRQSITR